MGTSEDKEGKTSGWSWGRWLTIVLALLFFGLVMREVLYPFAGEPYVEFPHGDHTHYAPKDRNENVPISQFPTQRPGPNERITPDGQVVAKNNQ